MYCSSSDAVHPKYFEVARELGTAIARECGTLVYGGTHIGLMGEIARATYAAGGKVIGVIPQIIHQRGLAYDQAHEVVLTRDLRERKHEMESRSDAFIALPGGVGTFEEVLEMLALKQLKVHTKPIILLNQDGYYDPLIALLEHAIRGKFMKAGSRLLYFNAPTVADAMDHLRNYTPPDVDPKWFEAAEA